MTSTNLRNRSSKGSRSSTITKRRKPRIVQVTETKIFRRRNKKTENVYQAASLFIWVKSCLAFLLIFLVCTALSVAAPKETELIPGSYYYTFSEQVNTFDTSMTLLPIDSKQAIVLSCGTTIWVDEGAVIQIDQNGLEHHPATGDYYLTINLLQGGAYFTFPSPPNETTVVMINTPSAEMEIHSSEFSVEAVVFDDKEITILRCYSGFVVLTNTKTFKTTTVDAGQRASIMARDDNKNTSILLGKIDQISTDKWNRIIDTLKIPILTWTLKDGRYIIKRS